MVVAEGPQWVERGLWLRVRKRTLLNITTARPDCRPAVLAPSEGNHRTLAAMQGDDAIAITFDQAIGQTGTRTRYLLLGNGFSINARPSFTYSSLFRQSGPFSEPVAALFRDLDTQDFERVLGVLRPKVEDAIAPPPVRDEWKRQEDEVRDGFIDALSRVHPDNAMLLGRDEGERCIAFLEHFVGRRRPERQLGRIYTTNYDMLLYWVLARSGKRLTCYDSHISPVDDKTYGRWDRTKTPGLVYLHGALHLYDRRNGGQDMLRYRDGQSLIAQIRARLRQGEFPVIVSEGDSKAKQWRIGRSAYLRWAGHKLVSGMRDTNGALFTYGHGLDDRDCHLLRCVGAGRIPEVYIGAWGGLHGDQGDCVRKWARRWREVRGDGPPLTVYVYNTATYSPWR